MGVPAGVCVCVCEDNHDYSCVYIHVIYISFHLKNGSRARFTVGLMQNVHWDLRSL